MRALAFGRGSGPTGAFAPSPHEPATTQARNSEATSERFIGPRATRRRSHTRPVLSSGGYLSAVTSPQTPLRPQALNTPPWKMRNWYWLSAFSQPLERPVQ